MCWSRNIVVSWIFLKHCPQTFDSVHKRKKKQQKQNLLMFTDTVWNIVLFLKPPMNCWETHRYCFKDVFISSENTEFQFCFSFVVSVWIRHYVIGKMVINHINITYLVKIQWWWLLITIRITSVSVILKKTFLSA